jgi:hypothetical protein
MLVNDSDIEELLAIPNIPYPFAEAFINILNISADKRDN